MYKPAKPFKHQILKAIEGTWNTPYIEVRRGVYPTFKKKFSGWEVDHTDGIGTKGFYHWKAGTFRNAVIDALAMNLNDLALVRATPYKLSNHITVPVEDARVFKVVQAVVSECRKRNIAVVGGENSFHNTLDGLDISMTVSGFAPKHYTNLFRAGDAVIGLKSAGLHSNGMTAVRRLFGHKLRPEFTAPTKIYLGTILELNKKYTIHGMMHMTGGSFTKLKDVLGKNDVHIEHPKALWPQKIFFDIYERGFSDREMYRTFNCGIGFVLSVPKNQAQSIVRSISGSALIGEVKSGVGRVSIRSAFTKNLITF
jgi:phosphoribosylformylglycinamidine cyclo-ligase